MRTLKAGTLYFVLVFAVGFVLGTIRQLWVTPRLGARMSELLEEPLMLVTVVLTARWIVRKLSPPPALSQRLGMGLIALVLLIAAELSLVLGIQRQSLRQYIASREPVSGVVYLLMLGLFAFLPCFVGRRAPPDSAA